MAAGGMGVMDVWGQSVMLQPGRSSEGGAEPTTQPSKPPEALKEGEKNREPEKAAEKAPLRLRELGVQDRQAGCQASARELLRRAKARHWGTQDSSKPKPHGSNAPKALPKNLGPSSKPRKFDTEWLEDWKSLKLLCHFLAAVKSQMGVTGKEGKKMPKGMEETVEVLGGLGELFLPTSAFMVLTTPPIIPPLPPLPAEPSKRFLEMLEKLPEKPAKRLLQEAVKKKRLVTLGEVVEILKAYAVHMEATDRAVKGLLGALVKKKLLHPADLDDYLVLVTVQLKTTELNHPLVFVKALSADHADMEADGEVGLKRRSSMQPFLPAHPRSLNLRVLGSLLRQLAELPEAAKEADEAATGGPSAALCLLAARDLAETQLSLQKTRALSSGLVSLSLVARFLSHDSELPAELRQLGATITGRLRTTSFGPWDAQELASAFNVLGTRIFVSSAQWKELVGRLKEAGWLSSGGQDLLRKVFCGGSTSLGAALGWLVELVEGEGEWGELGRRQELSPESVMGEPARSGRQKELGEGVLGAALSLMVEYVVAVRTERLERGREGREEREEEREQRRVLVERLGPLAADLSVPAQSVAAATYLAQGAETPPKLAALLLSLFPTLRLTREQLLPVGRSGWAVGFEPTADADRVHHMLLFGCSSPGGPTGGVAECLHGGVCRGPQKILYAWARNAPAFHLPDHLGFPVGPHAGFSHLVLQVHYARPLEGDVRDYSGVTLGLRASPPPFSAAVFLFMGMASPIPAHRETFFMNMSCAYSGKTAFTPFAFRTHTHGLGRLVSAAVRRQGQWHIVGKRNPQWPQLFQKIPPKEYYQIRPGDVLAGQCRYNTSERGSDTFVGATGHDEMCNFYMMHFWKSEEPAPFSDGGTCVMDREAAFEGQDPFPAAASALLPPRPAEVETAKQGSSFGRRLGRSSGAYDESEAPLGPRLPSRVFRLHEPRDGAEPSPASARPPPTSVTEDGKWSRLGEVELGQVAGLAAGPDNRLLVFHRGHVVWGPATFDESNRLRERTAISAPAVVEVNCLDMSVVAAWGEDSFYVPHGVALGRDGRVWTTDVGSHQVQRWSRAGKLERSWGVAFEPGSDQRHFCKPAAVAVASDGSFYVADGYCNNRVVVFGADGSWRAEWGRRSEEVGPGGAAALGTFLLPHDLSLDETAGRLSVADRQNGRVQLLRLNGTSLAELRPAAAFRSVYATDSCSHDGLVFLLPGEAPVDGSALRVFAADPASQGLAYDFAPSSQPLRRPHILRASPDCRHLFVGEIAGKTGLLWRFRVKRDSPSHAHAAPPAPPAAAAKPDVGPDASVPASAERGSKAGASGAGASGAVSGAVEGRGGLWATLAAVGLAVGLAGASVWAWSRCRAAGSKRRAMSLGSVAGGLFPDSRSHKGFQRLRTEDVDAVDDVTDDSDQDELYHRP